MLLMTAARCQKAADQQTALLAARLEDGDGGIIDVTVVMSWYRGVLLVIGIML